MRNLIVINPGSDHVFDGILTDETGPIDITGAELSLFEPLPVLETQVSFTITDAAAGAFSCSIKWSNNFPRDLVMPLRLVLVQAGWVTAWPAVDLMVQE